MYSKIVLDVSKLATVVKRLADMRLPAYPVDDSLANAVLPGAKVWEALAVSRPTNTPGRYATDVGIIIAGDKPEDDSILRATWFGSDTLAPGDTVKCPDTRKAVLRVKADLAEDGTQRTFTRRDGTTDKAWRVELQFAE